MDPTPPSPVADLGGVAGALPPTLWGGLRPPAGADLGGVAAACLGRRTGVDRSPGPYGEPPPPLPLGVPRPVLVTLRSRTKTPQVSPPPPPPPPPPPRVSKYLTPSTDPSFLPLEAEGPVSLTPTQSVPEAKWTRPT